MCVEKILGFAYLAYHGVFLVILWVGRVARVRLWKQREYFLLIKKNYA